MAAANTAVNELAEVLALLAPTAVGDDTPVASTPLDLRTLAPGARLLLVLTALETNAANTGGEWTVEVADAANGDFEEATLAGGLEATPEQAGNNVQTVAVIPDHALPFLRVTYTGADSDTDVTVTATLVALNRAM